MENEIRIKPERGTRRGFLAAIGGGLAVFATQIARTPSAQAAAGGNMVLGADNDSGLAETVLRSDPSGDKATLAILNETGVQAGTRPDGLRAFAVGAGQGAAVQAFGGPGSFAPAPFDGIGVRARGKKAGVVAESLAALNVPAAGVTGKTTSGGSQPGTRMIGVWGIEPQNNPYGEGVLGESPGGNGRGVTGVSGYTESSIGQSGPPGAGVWGAGTSYGVFGSVQNPGATAVRGDAGAGGTGGFFQGQTGVHAIAISAGGTAVIAHAPDDVVDAFALDAKGKTKFENVGTATIASGANSVDVSVDNIAGAVVLATLQTSAGSIAVRNAGRVDNTKIRIRLTDAATRNLNVGWMIVYPSA